MEEIWKDIEGYEESYQISNLGRIRSKFRWLNSGYNSKRSEKGKLLKIKIDKYGYPGIGLNKNRKTKYTTIHRLVATTFIPNPKNKPQINHKDGDKLNNAEWNLEWCTGLENQRHAVNIGLRINAPQRGEISKSAKLLNKDIFFIRKNYNKKVLNQKTLSNMFGVSISTISMILSRKIWNHI